jgi:uncharacterized protein YdhG (YjbR/CyaY superfamily)
MEEVEKYLLGIPPEQRAALEHIRDIAKELAPDATEGISYGMPGFKLNGKYLLGYAAFSDHLSLFPTSTPIEAFKDRLADYKLSKGTIQFTLENPIPDDLLKAIISYRINNL